MKTFAAYLSVVFLAATMLSEDPSAQSQPKQVELELVLAMDTSSSVDAFEFELQKQGVAAAFRHPAVLDAIESCGGADIAVALVQWSGNRMHLIAVDWTLIGDEESADVFAGKVEAMGRLLSGFTGLRGAISFSLKLIEENDLEGRRKVIDISGDGSGGGLKPSLERDRAVARGATINGLAILAEEPDLEQYYASFVAGGPGAFVMSVAGFDGFADAIRSKLQREILCPKVARGAPVPAKRDGLLLASRKIAYGDRASRIARPSRASGR